MAYEEDYYPGEDDEQQRSGSGTGATEDDDDDFINAEGDDDDDDQAQDDAASVDTDEDYEPSSTAREIARREKARLRELERQKKENMDRMRLQQNQIAVADEAQRGRARLNFLLQQAEIFQHFTASKPGDKSAKKGRGRGCGATEEQEDSVLLKDEADDGPTQTHRLTVQPSCIKFGTMREYQMQGLNWLIHLYDNGINGILADEMGLGKTLQTISLLGYLHEYRGITGPHMVLVPKSTLHNWLNEFRRWCPLIRAKKFHGNADERNRAKMEDFVPGRFDVCITSFEMVIKEKNFFKRFHWRYIIIDEAHRIKNENSTLSRVVRMMHTSYRLLITGTPLQNNLHELWALLNFLLPEVFSSSEKFDEWFNLGNSAEGEAEVVQQLHKVLRPFLLRRVKSDVERGLPPKKETILKIGMSAMQKKYYAALLQKDIDAVNAGSDRSRLLNIVMQLRKCCNHPYLFQGAEPGPPYITGDHLMENSGKMVLLDKLLPKLKERESRVLIFSQMTRMLDIMEDYCLYKGYQYCRIDGNTSGDDRENAIDSFNAEGSEKFIFLLSTRAGGLGINLATADIVILYDSDWNPQMDLQAMDRAHRIGQKKEVQVFRFCVANSVEEKVIEKAYKKLRLDALVIQQGRMTESKTSVNKDDLLSMVRYGAETVFSSEAESITDADIDDILKKGEDETRAMNEKMAEFTDNARKFTLDGGMLSDFKDNDDSKDAIDALNMKAIMASNWVDPPKRERKRIHNYSEQDYFRQAMNRPQLKGGPKLSKMPQLHDFQFYDTNRLSEIFEKEHAYEIHKHQLKMKEAAARQQGASEDVVQAQLVPSPDDPLPLTEEEEEEKTQLLEKGFSTWTRKDFNSFVRACEKYGRSSLKEIASEIEGKTEEEVKAYAKVFWKRYEDLADSDRIIKAIERGEQRIQRQQDIMDAIATKLDNYKNPMVEMKIQYGANKGKAYTEEEDRFILCTVHKLGYGAWDELKAEIHRSWRFRFDWFFKSRTPQELARRCDTLIRLVEKENEENEAQEEKKKSTKTGSKGVSDSSGLSGKRKASSLGGSEKKRK